MWTVSTGKVASLVLFDEELVRNHVKKAGSAIFTKTWAACGVWLEWLAACINLKESRDDDVGFSRIC